MPAKKNYDYLVGKRFGKLLILSWKQINGRMKAECMCECGVIKFMRIDILYKRKSCGCTPPVYVTGERCNLYVDGRQKDKLYHVWCTIKSRLYNKNCKEYPSYGGRGIYMCEEWGHYPNFKLWAINNGYKNKLSIDRINNNGNYEPNNCRWVTQKEQCQNKRTNVYVEYMGEIKTISQWKDQLGFNYGTVRSRMNRHFKKTGEYKLIL